ncbi:MULTISPECIES: DUF2732 family protein [Dickeya]|uniref:DUF2732 family protein n=1 Tax=Dickeya aquatica TaxID=1401087 RepID=A0A375ABD4_9GAMM|nr:MULTISPECIES: DUF2732 family protein [Dickeya]SLM63424.1 hypothetical protein DAQ1742_02546 [Dickeya aquatica]
MKNNLNHTLLIRDTEQALACRYSEHLERLAQHAGQENLSADELVALLEQEAEKIRHHLWETH